MPEETRSRRTPGAGPEETREGFERDVQCYEIKPSVRLCSCPTALFQHPPSSTHEPLHRRPRLLPLRQPHRRGGPPTRCPPGATCADPLLPALLECTKCAPSRACSAHEFSSRPHALLQLQPRARCSLAQVLRGHGHETTTGDPLGGARARHRRDGGGRTDGRGHALVAPRLRECGNYPLFALGAPVVDVSRLWIPPDAHAPLQRLRHSRAVPFSRRSVPSEFLDFHYYRSILPRPGSGDPKFSDVGLYPSRPTVPPLSLPRTPVPDIISSHTAYRPAQFLRCNCCNSLLSLSAPRPARLPHPHFLSHAPYLPTSVPVCRDPETIIGRILADGALVRGSPTPA